MVVTSDGKENLISYLVGNSPTPPSHIAFGTGVSTPNAEDTALATEFSRFATTDKTASGTEVAFTTVMSTALGNGTTFRELGLLNAVAAGTLFERSTFVDIDKTSSFEISAIITLRIE